jgi:SAM-dependent methyltransferase
MAIHEAALGFETGAEAYERARPDYPRHAIAFLIEHLGLRAGASVLDIGAGTGKLSRLLLASGAEVIALEPIAGMRRKFSEVMPTVQILEGVAEAIPFPDCRFDAATAGQALHWFANDRALDEIRRVLKPEGRFGVIFNVRDASTEWVRDLWKIIDAAEGDAPRHRKGAWRSVLETFAGFRKVAEKSVHHSQRGGIDLMWDRVASISFIAKMADAQRAALEQRVRELLRTHPQTRGRDAIELPYRTDTAVYQRV